MKRNTITCTPAGYGHYRISMMYRGREISCITTNMPAIDNYKSDPDEKHWWYMRRKRVNIGYEDLRRELINSITK